jgi:pimeloyl-ACP methyl ester carboxylesterase
MTSTERPPILFIHGAFSHPGHFAPWISFFSEAGFACHAPALPGHQPGDPAALKTLGLDDYLAAVRREAARLSQPPIIIGHSMGGLLAMQFATTAPCRALVCVASAPPWILTAQFRALPHLVPMLPRLIKGEPLMPSEAALRELVLNALPPDEQEALLPTFGAESGRAYRAMLLGLASISALPKGPALVVSGLDDRIVSAKIAALIARVLRARHEMFSARGHWLIAPSTTEQIAGAVLRWLDGVLADEEA